MSRADSIDFWYDFDNQTLFQRTPAMSDALNRAYFQHGMTFDSVAESLRTSFARPDHPAAFVALLQPAAQGMLDLAALQLGIVDTHLKNEDAIREAFEDFGQGVLNDNRPPRPPGRRIHMMDGTPDNWVGYQRWHAFMRAVQLLGGNAGRWLHLNRSMALAWAIQTEADPPVDVATNPGLPVARLAELRAAWMAFTPAKLDWAFANHRFRAPSIDVLRGSGTWSNAAPGRYAQVQQLLNDAAGTLNPMHDGHARFWLLPYAQFMALPPIYGEQLIADPGANRGDRSALVKVLRGTLPGFPQMPLNRPPLPTAQIDFIRDWIDADCPEN